MISAREIAGRALLSVSKLKPVMEATEPMRLTVSFQFAAIGVFSSSTLGRCVSLKLFPAVSGGDWRGGHHPRRGLSPPVLECADFFLLSATVRHRRDKLSSARRHAGEWSR